MKEIYANLSEYRKRKKTNIYIYIYTENYKQTKLYNTRFYSIASDELATLRLVGGPCGMTGGSCTRDKKKKEKKKGVSVCDALN